METTIFWARKGWPSLEVGVCGEHRGEPRSIRFFHDIGVDYVSCSPFRMPELAAAEVAAKNVRMSLWWAWASHSTECDESQYW